MANEFRRARREQHMLTFCLMDIDNFKRYDDNYGHLAGDDTLASVGETLRQVCRRPSDFALRIGGTVSMGLVNRVPLATDAAETFGRVADERLYRAKELGRNRVVAFE